ncbi:hypothetical protein SUGI_0119240 [Cryptomeria japonica]|nr:hypothetical protein SUGI_0119240 [Cryptomeria japonica]
MTGIPVTVSLVAIMVLLHLFPQFVVDSCTETKDFDPKQWFLSIFHYASKEQFAYQFFSLLCKGTLLERSVGSKRCCSSQNGVYVPVCETCWTTR